MCVLFNLIVIVLVLRLAFFLFVDFNQSSFIIICGIPLQIPKLIYHCELVLVYTL